MWLSGFAALALEQNYGQGQEPELPSNQPFRSN